MFREVFCFVIFVLDYYFVIDKLDDDIKLKEWKSLISFFLDEELKLFMVYKVEYSMYW